MGKRRLEKVYGRDLSDYYGLGYNLYCTKIGYDWVWYLIKIRENEGPDHAFLCWLTESLLLKAGLKPTIMATLGPDLSLELNGKKLCFEIETGKRLDRMKRRDMYVRFHERSQAFDLVVIVVPTERIARRYRGFGFEVITRASLKVFVRSLVDGNPLFLSRSLYSGKEKRPFNVLSTT